MIESTQKLNRRIVPTRIAGVRFRRWGVRERTVAASRIFTGDFLL